MTITDRFERRTHGRGARVTVAVFLPPPAISVNPYAGYFVSSTPQE